MRTRILRAVAIGFLTLMAMAAVVLSQTPAATEAAPPATFAHAPSPAAAVPQLTEVERLSFENLSLRAALLAEQQRQLQQQYQALAGQVEREHPGYLWNPAAQALVREAAPPPPAGANGAKR